MIKYKLQCKKCTKSFDSWFSSSKEFERIKKLKLLNCNFCKSKNIDKTLMAPNLRSKNINGKTAEDILQFGDITVNKNMVPFDTESPFITSGIRIGTPAITTRGLNENDCKKIVQFIDEILTNVNNLDRVNEIKIDVNNYMRKFPMFKV